MEHDDVLEDLLSWTGDQSPAAAPPAKEVQHRPSLQESCVNTARAVARKRRRVPTDADMYCGSSPPVASPPTSDNDDLEMFFTPADAGAPSSPTASQPTATPSPEGTFSLPVELEAKLFEHQKAGVQWLYRRHCKSRACLLADEMGLGKTVQVAAFLGELYRQRKIKTTIVVVPPTLMPMWAEALMEWGGDVLTGKVELLHNETKKKRQPRWRKLQYGLPCVFLTTYGVLRQDIAEMQATLVDYVVLDEAHLIKDARTAAFKSALSLSARHKIALSGTPLMNSFEDMWSVFRFLDGSILEMSRADFMTVSATLLKGNERNATSHQRADASAELAKLQAAIRPFILRREKKDLGGAVVSVKEDVVVWVRMSPVQQALYEAFLESKEATASPPALTERHLLSDMEAGGGVADTTNSDQGASSLVLLTMLSQICNHPWLTLIDGAFTNALAHPFIAPLPEMGDIFAGSKLWVALQLLVRCIAEQRKTLVFSRSKRLLHLLSALLRHWCMPHTQVDGDMASEQRYTAVADFNDDPHVWVCLLTTQVGGVGLTFNAASAVVLLDPSWNPSADAQAIDRVHRIGQTRETVRVFRLVTCGTVEEKVYRNQIFKRMAALQSLRGLQTGKKKVQKAGEAVEEDDLLAACATSVEQQQQQQPSSELFRYFTRVQLRSMFVLDDITQSSTAAQLEALHPNCVPENISVDLRRIEGVCDVSDNGCVLTEHVDPAAAAAAANKEEEATVAAPSSLSPSQACSPAAAAVAPTVNIAGNTREVGEALVSPPSPPSSHANPRRHVAEALSREEASLVVSPAPQRRRLDSAAEAAAGSHQPQQHPQRYHVEEGNAVVVVIDDTSADEREGGDGQAYCSPPTICTPPHFAAADPQLFPHAPHTGDCLFETAPRYLAASACADAVSALPRQRKEETPTRYSGATIFSGDEAVSWRPSDILVEDWRDDAGHPAVRKGEETVERMDVDPLRTDAPASTAAHSLEGSDGRESLMSAISCVEGDEVGSPTFPHASTSVSDAGLAPHARLGSTNGGAESVRWRTSVDERKRDSDAGSSDKFASCRSSVCE